MKRLVIVMVILAVVAGCQNRDKEIMEFSLCETLFKDAQYQNAAQSLESFLLNHPKSSEAAQAYYYLAMSREKLEERSKAMEAWSKIIEKYPKSTNRAEAYYYLGAGYQNLGQYDKARENYEAVVNRFSDTALAGGAWYGIGAIYEMNGEESKAINAYQNVMEKYSSTEFATDAERRWGNIRLKRFLAESTAPYTVERGDSLVRIGAKFNITPELIMKINGLTGGMLQTGQVLKVIKADFNILVDLSSFKLSLRSGGRVIKNYSIGIGKAETPTPTGDFKVTDKLPNPVWYSTLPSGAKEAIPPGDPRNELGTRWIGFMPAYGIHGTIEPESIGKATSKGCVRMHNQDVEELYDLVAVGTPVKIVAGMEKTRQPAAQKQEGGASEGKPQADVKLPDAVVSMLNKEYPGWEFPDVSQEVTAYLATSGSAYGPNLIWGDFDANGTKDCAVQIAHDARVKVIAFLGRRDSFDPYMLTSGTRSDPSPIETYLNLFRKGEEDYDYEAEKHFLYPSDSIGVAIYGKAGFSFIFQNGRFRKVLSSD